MKRRDNAAPKRKGFEFGTDEMNFAEFPMASISDYVRSDQRTLTFEDDITDASTQRKVHRKLVIAANDLFGLPTPADSDLLLLLIELTVQQNGLTERKVTFRRSELVNRRGWGDGGKAFRRIDESLKRWASNTLYYNGAWWDSSVKRWMSQTFHVIESLELHGKDDDSEDSLCSFTWSEVVFKSFQAKNIRPLNIETYFGLKRAAARRAFRFLDKRFYRSRRLEFDLKTFAFEHIGFSRQYDTGQIKRLLRPAIRELEAIGFLKELSEDDRFVREARGLWKIVFVRGERYASVPDDGTKPLGVAGELCRRGVHAAAAKRLESQFPRERVLEKLLGFDRLVAAKDARVSKNPPGFLVRAIEKDYPLGGGAPGKTEASRHRETATCDLPPATNPGTSTPPWKVEFLSLPESQKAEIEKAAFDSADLYLLTGHRRAVESGQPAVAESYRDMILERYLQSQKSKAA